MMGPTLRNSWNHLLTYRMPNGCDTKQGSLLDAKADDVAVSFDDLDGPLRNLTEKPTSNRSFTWARRRNTVGNIKKVTGADSCDAWMSLSSAAADLSELCDSSDCVESELCEESSDPCDVSGSPTASSSTASGCDWAKWFNWQGVCCLFVWKPIIFFKWYQKRRRMIFDRWKLFTFSPGSAEGGSHCNSTLALRKKIGSKKNEKTNRNWKKTRYLLLFRLAFSVTCAHVGAAGATDLRRGSAKANCIGMANDCSVASAVSSRRTVRMAQHVRTSRFYWRRHWIRSGLMRRKLMNKGITPILEIDYCFLSTKCIQSLAWKHWIAIVVPYRIWLKLFRKLASKPNTRSLISHHLIGPAVCFCFYVLDCCVPGFDWVSAGVFWAINRFK